MQKIGTLKNGEEKTFLVEDGARRVFVIADKLSKDYYNDCYKLPDNSDDIFVTGRAKFNLAEGNAFIFDNNNTENIAQYHKNNKKIGKIVLIVSIIIGAIIGFTIGFSSFSNLHETEVVEKTFYSDGLNITLTNEFTEIDIENYDVAYNFNDIDIFMLKEPFSLSEGSENLSIDEYVELVKANNNFDDSISVNTVDGLTYFSYTFKNEELNVTYLYYTYL